MRRYRFLAVDRDEHYGQRLYYWLRPKRLPIVGALFVMYGVVRQLFCRGRLLGGAVFGWDWNEVFLCSEPRNELDAEGDYELEAEHGDEEGQYVCWP